MRLFYDNLIDYDGVIIAPSSEGTLLRAENVTHEHKSKVWKTGTGLTDEYIVFDLGTSKTVTSAIIVGHNISAADVTKIQGNDSDAWTSPTVDETITHDAAGMGKAFTGGTLRYWRLLIEKDQFNAAVEVGRLYVGEYETLPQPRSYSDRIVDLSDISRSVGGQTFSYAKPAYRRFSLNYAHLSESDYATLKTVGDTTGVHTSLFAQIDTSSPMDEYLYCKFASLSGRQYVHATCGGTYYWQTDISLEEQI